MGGGGGGRRGGAGVDIRTSSSYNVIAEII